MRRPDIELSDAAARYVEEHPGVIEKLAGGLPDAESADVAALRVDIRARLRDRLATARTYAESPEGRAAADAFLAKVGLNR